MNKKTTPGIPGAVYLKRYSFISETTDIPVTRVHTSTDIVALVKQFFGDDIDVYESFYCVAFNRAHRPVGYAQFETFHPTFLYEALWNLVGIALLLYLDRRFRLGYGRVFALYVMIYTAGRGWIETLRIDTIELNDVLGLRWGVWMSIVLFVGAAIYFVVTGRRHPRPDSREPTPYVAGRGPADADDEVREEPDVHGSTDETSSTPDS